MFFKKKVILKTVVVTGEQAKDLYIGKMGLTPHDANAFWDYWALLRDLIDFDHKDMDGVNVDAVPGHSVKLNVFKETLFPFWIGKKVV